MTIIQQAVGTFSPSGGANIEVALPAPSSPASRVVIVVAGNTLVNTPAGFDLSESEVNTMGHYWWTGAGGDDAWTLTEPGALGSGMWWAAELAGELDVIAGANGGSDTSYSTPPLTPTAGPRLLIASVGASTGSAGAVRTIDAWSNGFEEQADTGVGEQDSPMGGIAVLEVEADGLTAYSTTATFSALVGARSAIVAAFTVPTSDALVVADAAHVHVVDSVTLTQHHSLAVAGAVHLHTADNITLRTSDDGSPELDLNAALILASPWTGHLDEARWNGEIT